MPVAELQKEDCLTIDEAWKRLDKTRATLYNYMNILRIQRHRFPFDRKTYITKGDFERIEQFLRERGDKK